MPDISQLSDSQLQTMLGQSQGSPNLSKLSDADLKRMLNSSQPADANLQQQASAQFGMQHPYLKTLQDTVSQGIFNPIAQATNSITPVINGLNKVEGNNFNIPQMNTPDMSNAPMAARVLGDVAGGVPRGIAAGLMSGGSPLAVFPAYGALSGLDAYGKGQNVVPAIENGTISAIPQALGGVLGSSVASGLAKPLGNIATKMAPRIGSSLGMAGGSAALAPFVGQNPLQAAISGGIFGSMTPSPNVREMFPINQDKIITDAAQKYRDVLNPSKSILQKVEMKSGKNIDDAFKIAAQEGLIINKDPQNKLDTTGAIGQLQPSINNLHQQLTSALASDPHKQFDLEDVRDMAKDSLSTTIKNAQDLNEAHNQIDGAIDAEIARNGQFVNGSTLNNIKQGLWSKGYDPLSPNSDATSRKIGNVVKTMIEQAYPENNIQQLNKKMGDYLNLQKILQASHGNIIQGGKLGKYAANITGLLLGHGSGILGGELLGSHISGSLSDHMNNPYRITSNISNKINKIKGSSDFNPFTNNQVNQ